MAGVDVGSTSAKAVLFDGEVKGYAVRPTGWHPRTAGEEVLNVALNEGGFKRQDVNYIVGTGYGRVALKIAGQTATEITCQARGIHYLTGGASVIIDIGGQDTKVITIDEQGKVIDFMMNDKCAAGTGRFLEVMATALGMDVEELGRMPKNIEPANISSMCTVFAETEVIGLLAAGVSREEIVAGLHRAVARRVKGMLRNTLPSSVIFTGGGAKNEGLRHALTLELGVKVEVPPEPQITAALGAAIIAWEKCSGRRISVTCAGENCLAQGMASH